MADEGGTLPPVIAVLKADADQFIAGVDEATAALGELEGEKADPRVGLDKTGFDAGIAEVQTALAGLDAEKATADLGGFSQGLFNLETAAQAASVETESLGAGLVDLEGGLSAVGPAAALGAEDIDTLRIGAADAVSLLEGMGLAGRNAGGDLLDMNGNVTNSSRLLSSLGITFEDGTISLEGFTMAAADAAESIDSVGASAGAGGGGFTTFTSAIEDAMGPVSGLQAGLGALAVSAIPIAGVLTGGMIGFAGATAAAVSGLGAFALAAAGDFKSVESSLKSTLSTWQGSVEQYVTPVLQELPGLFKSALGDITPLVQSTGAALSNVFHEISQNLNDADFKQFIQFLASEVPAALQAGEQAFANFGEGIGRMLEAAAPLITDVENGFVSLSKSFDSFAGSSAFKSFVDYAISEAPVVGNFFRQLGTDAMQLLIALAPLGDALLRVGTTLLTALQPALPLLTALAEGVDMVVKAFSPLFNVIDLASRGLDALLGPLGGIATNMMGAGAGAEQLGASFSVANQSIASFNPVAQAVNESLSKLQQQQSSAASATQSAWQQSTSAIQAFSGATQVTGAQIQTFFSTQITSAQQFSSNISKAIADGYSPQLINQIEQAGPAAEGLLQGLVSSASSSFVGMVNGAVSALGQLTNAAVEQSRLMQVAIHASTSAVTANFSSAMAIDQQLAAHGGMGMSQSFISSFQGGLPAIDRIAAEYGIALPKGVQEQIGAAESAGTSQAMAANQGQSKGLGPAQVLGSQTGSNYASGLTAAQGQTAAAGVGHVNALVGSLNTGLFKSLTSGQGSGQNFGDGVSSKTGASSSAASSLVSAAMGPLNGASGPAGAAGAAAGAAFAAALAGAVGAAIGAADARVGAALSAATAWTNSLHIGAFAEGGVVNSPTLALVGEAGPEAVIPLNDPSRAAAIMEQAGLPGITGGGASGYGGGGGNVNVVVNINGTQLNEQQLTRAVQNAITSQQRGYQGQSAFVRN